MLLTFRTLEPFVSPLVAEEGLAAPLAGELPGLAGLLLELDRLLCVEDLLLIAHDNLLFLDFFFIKI